MLPSSCVTPAGTSIEVQNEWEENTHTHSNMSSLTATSVVHIGLPNQGFVCFKSALITTLSERCLLLSFGRCLATDDTAVARCRGRFLGEGGDVNPWSRSGVFGRLAGVIAAER